MLAVSPGAARRRAHLSPDFPVCVTVTGPSGLARGRRASGAGPFPVQPCPLSLHLIVQCPPKPVGHGLSRERASSHPGASPPQGALGPSSLCGNPSRRTAVPAPRPQGWLCSSGAPWAARGQQSPSQTKGGGLSPHRAQLWGPKGQLPGGLLRGISSQGKSHRPPEAQEPTRYQKTCLPFVESSRPAGGSLPEHLGEVP